MGKIVKQFTKVSNNSTITPKENKQTKRQLYRMSRFVSTHLPSVRGVRGTRPYLKYLSSYCAGGGTQGTGAYKIHKEREREEKRKVKSYKQRMKRILCGNEDKENTDGKLPVISKKKVLKKNLSVDILSTRVNNGVNDIDFLSFPKTPKTPWNKYCSFHTREHENQYNQGVNKHKKLQDEIPRTYHLR